MRLEQLTWRRQVLGRGATYLAFAPDSQRLTFIAEQRNAHDFERFDVPVLHVADHAPGFVQGVIHRDFTWGSAADVAPMRWNL